MTQALQEGLAMWMNSPRDPAQIAEWVDEQTEHRFDVPFPKEEDLPESWHEKRFGVPAPKLVPEEEDEIL